MRTLLPLTLVLLPFAFSSMAADLNHEHRRLQLPTQQINLLLADTGAGSLVIEADPSSQEIIVEADIYAEDLSQARFELQQKSGQAYLRADFEQAFVSHWTQHESPRIDLVIKMPAALALKLDDGSGDIRIEGLTSSIKVSDGSGAITIKGGKDLSLDDGSGDVDIQQIQGNVRIDDGSGELRVRDIGGDLVIDDGSGDLHVTQIKGRVTITDGSGDINVNTAASLDVLESGSGTIQYQNIVGSVTTDKQKKTAR